MDSPILGIVLDTSVLIAFERERRTAKMVIEIVRRAFEDPPLAIAAITVAEMAHGVHRGKQAHERDIRRRFLYDLIAGVPVHPFTLTTAEIVGEVGGTQAARGVNLPLADLIIGASALELGFSIATRNARDFSRIPGYASSTSSANPQQIR